MTTTTATTDALTLLRGAAGRVGAAAQAHDDAEVQKVQAPLAEERAQLVVKHDEWLRAGTESMPTWQQWERAFGNPAFDRLKAEGREGKARRLAQEGREDVATTMNQLKATPPFIKGLIATIDAGPGRYDQVDAWIVKRRQEIEAHLDGDPHRNVAGWIAQFEAKAEEIADLLPTTSAWRRSAWRPPRSQTPSL